MKPDHPEPELHPSLRPRRRLTPEEEAFYDADHRRHRIAKGLPPEDLTPFEETSPEEVERSIRLARARQARLYGWPA